MSNIQQELYDVTWRMRLAGCLSEWAPKLSPVGRGYNWIMGDHLGIASHVLIIELGT